MENWISEPESYSAFDGHKLLSQGGLEKVVLKVKDRLKAEPASSILIFSDATGKQMDFDLRGSEKEILRRLEIYTAPVRSDPPAGPGRPKLGVISREVSLLPRHWEWLSTQSGGASSTLRRLVDEARKGSSNQERMKLAQERTYKFMSSIAGDLPGYEEALRALFAKNKKKFESQIEKWPRDIKKHSLKLSDSVFERSK